MRQALTERKRRKVERARAQLNLPVEVLFRRDFERLADRWRLPALAHAAGARAEV
jgi:hypothetical protein